MTILRKIKEKSTEELKFCKTELYNKIVKKQNFISRYEMLICQMKGSCLDYITDYETIDRIIFVREGKINILPPSGQGKIRPKEKLPIEKNIEELSEKEASDLLKQLLDIKQSRLQKNPLQNMSDEKNC